MLKETMNSNHDNLEEISEIEISSENQSAELIVSDGPNNKPKNGVNVMFDNIKTTKEVLEKQNAYVSSLGDTLKQLQIIQADTFLDSMRNSGYKGLPQALGDLVDNSIEALSDQIHLITEVGSSGTGKKKAVQKLAIIDNGTGMNEGMIVPALSFGGTHRHGGEGLFGRYGFGLPAASVFISESVTIYSKTREMKKWYSGVLNLKDVREGKCTDSNTGIPMFEKAKIAKEFPPYITDYLTENGIALEHGTIVELAPDRLGSGFKNPSAFEDKILRYIGQTYRNFLQSVEIFVNGNIVQPIDPLFLTPGARGFDIGTKFNATMKPVQSFEQKAANGKTGLIRLRLSYLDLEGFSKKYAKGDKNKIEERHKIATENNCIMIICRAGREIDRLTSAHWSKGFKTVQNNDRYWAFELDFDPVLDELFGVTTAKQQISIEQAIWDTLVSKNIPQALTKARNDAELGLKKLANADSDTENREVSLTSEEIALDVGKLQRSRIQDPEKVQKEADQRLEDEAEIIAKEGNRKVEEVIREFNEETKTNRFKIMTQSIIGGPFYRTELFGQQLRVFLNESHVFYNDFYMDLDPHGKTCVQLWLFALATCEGFSNENLKTIYENERSLWSNYLNSAITKLVSIEKEGGTHATEMESEDIAEEIQVEQETAEETA